MYQSIFCDFQKKTGITAHLWDDQLGYKTFSYKRYAYRLTNKKTPYRTIFGQPVVKTTYWTPEEVSAGIIFESDVPTETRILVDLYHESDEPSTNHNILFFDIEVDTTFSFPDVQLAENKITSIALYDTKSRKFKVLILDEDQRLQTTDVIIPFETERRLLAGFLDEYAKINPTILTGWNISGGDMQEGFDIPYLYRRLLKLHPSKASCLSPIQKSWYDERRKSYVFAGISCLDYFSLYRKFSINERSSYSLNNVCIDELKKGKLEFEGTLSSLYEKDISKFIEYNIYDVQLVKELDEKLRFIELAQTTCHRGRVPYERIYHSSRYIEGAFLSYLKRFNLVSPNKPRQSGKKFTGAIVNDPIGGRESWVIDLDLQSLYPSCITSLNISPETKVGKIKNWNELLKEKIFR